MRQPLAGFDAIDRQRLKMVSLVYAPCRDESSVSMTFIWSKSVQKNARIYYALFPRPKGTRYDEKRAMKHQTEPSAAAFGEAGSPSCVFDRPNVYGISRCLMF